MKYGVYAVKDDLVGFMEPTISQSDAIAIRQFDFAVNRKDTIITENKKHFSLYKLGEYDSELGTIEPKIELIVDASSLARGKENV